MGTTKMHKDLALRTKGTITNDEMNKVQDAEIMLNEAGLILQGITDDERHLEKAWVLIIYAIARLQRVTDFQ